MQSAIPRTPRTPQLPTRRHAPRRLGRSAFSLIELMVVILIIAILAGLLLNGVMAARQTALNAGVVAELKNLEKSIQDFNLKFGVEPPSYIVLFEDRAAWTTIPAVPSGQIWTAADVQRSRSFLRQIWPEFSFVATDPDVDINGDFDTTDILELRGAECLVFFLGGVNSTNVVSATGTLQSGASAGDVVTSWTPLGFSVNPANPFARGGSRLGPYYEFSNNRLMNSDGTSDAEGLPEYRDSLPGQRNPLLYCSSYDGKGYRDEDCQLTTQPDYPTQPTSFAWYYRTYSGTYPATVSDFNAAPAFNANSFQLISPGMDGEYGWGGTLNADMSVADPAPERTVERDNITNFKGGRLD